MKLISIFLLSSLPLVIPSTSYGLPKCFPIADGDYRHLYPRFCVGIGIFANTERHVLPYFMGFIEDLRYPKDQIHVNFFATNESAISRWLADFPPGLYRSALLSTMEADENWREQALVFGRRKSCQFLLIVDTDSLLMRDSLRQMVGLVDGDVNGGKKIVVVSPLLHSPFELDGSNARELQLQQEFIGRQKIDFIRVYYSKGPLLINLGHRDAAYLTFAADNLPNYTGTGTPIDVFAASAFAMDIPILFSNHHQYGYFFDSATAGRAEHAALFFSFLANWVSDAGPSPYPLSSALPPSYPVPTRLGFDQIYLINLGRRPERLEKMREILRLLGVEFHRFEAVDGHNLTQGQISATLKFMPNYLDPFHRRPMKLGEIGCFLSHHKIWQDIVQQGHQRAIVLEDDVRFTPNGTLIIKGMVEDLMKTRLDWDFIYLGRKRMGPTSEEYFVPGHRFLSTVTYSYWTLGYAISTEGARKLLAARPLDRMLALDEFLPIMYGRHPSAEWSAHFAVDGADDHHLRAFALYPAAVEPERYTHQQGYVSDTEASSTVEGMMTVEREGKEGKMAEMGDGEERHLDGLENAAAFSSAFMDVKDEF